ncbi:activator of photopigment and puc with BLUF domain protein [Sphingomonas sp. Leaf33]|uniref:BLUF domain-containing protein n=1 Tax=Sphingomonas sp. Leaf33 TaxID=1736215 RepID=UPI0006F9D3C9|nr:BLUF domain-containing protein [Sphingomonas sp. Leaf33]KQN26538.1 activator of photopigment and puc with BLUF domain protein [Sphingomonas sp. Leaf33]
MRQILYISTAAGKVAGDHADDILATSRRNNGADKVTGLLYFDGKRFLQALEGDEIAVSRALARIEKDARHRAIVILSDRTVEAREFGDWSMAYRVAGQETDQFIARVSDLVAGASPNVRATFTSFAEARRAA